MSFPKVKKGISAQTRPIRHKYAPEQIGKTCATQDLRCAKIVYSNHYKPAQGRAFSALKL